MSSLYSDSPAFSHAYAFRKRAAEEKQHTLSPDRDPVTRPTEANLQKLLVGRDELLKVLFRLKE